jgi:heme-degrading monooxygenase HmoA
MIVRTWKGRALPESADAYQTHVTETVFPRLRNLEGYIGGRVLRRGVGDHIEFLVMTEWTSRQAIHAFAGNDSDLAVVEPAARAVLSDFDRHVEHFEVAFETKR